MMFYFTKLMGASLLVGTLLLTSKTTAVQQEPLEAINLTTLRKKLSVKQQLTGKGSNVIIIDAGFNINHQELKQNFTDNCINITTSLPLSAKDDDDHGTHITGIIVGKNGKNHYGVAPDAKVKLIRVADTSSYGLKTYEQGYNEDILKALQLAAKSKGDIVSMSVNLRHDKLGAISQDVKKALIAIAKSGKSIYFAPGNTSLPLGSTEYSKSLVEISESPEMMGAMVLVGNLDNTRCTLDDKLNWSSDEAGISKRFLTAPGTDVLSTVGSYGHVKKSGTSMATPMVAGTAALLKQAFPSATPQQLNDLLFATARKKGSFGPLDQSFGHGIVDILAAYTLGKQQFKVYPPSATKEEVQDPIVPPQVQKPAVAPQVIQKPAVAPQVVQKPVAPPQVVQKPATPPQVKKPTAAPQVVQKPVAPPQVVQKPATPPQVKKPAAVPQVVKKPVALSKVQKAVAPPQVKKTAAAPQVVQKPVTPPQVQKPVAPPQVKKPVAPPK